MSDIILPSVIDEGYFEKFFEKVNEVISNDEFAEEEDQTIYMICDGNGGDFAEVMRCIEYMRMLKNVKFYGYILSEAYSGHSMIWAACETRGCSEHAVLGVHDISLGLHDGTFSTKSINNLFKRLSRNLQYMVDIYQNACSKNADHDWYEALYDTGLEFIVYDRKDLLKLGMITSEEL